MNKQPFYAVRVTITYDDGSISSRDYVRGETRMGQSRFASYALGDMMRLVTTGTSAVKWELRSITPDEVYENRRIVSDALANRVK